MVDDFASLLPNSLTDVLETLDKERSPIHLSTERRAYGKKVTLIAGFDKTTDVKKIAKLLKIIKKLTTVSRFVSPGQQIALLTRGQTSSPYITGAK